MIVSQRPEQGSALLESYDLSRSRALMKSTAHFARPRGADLLARTEGFLHWLDARRDIGVWQYTRSMEKAPEAHCILRDERGRMAEGINFSSQDYLSLSSHPAVVEAGIRALRDWGPHSAGSPILTGNSRVSLQLEEALAEMLHMKEVMLFPTGWGAGFGTITGLVRADDHIILDKLAHNCLRTGAQAATQNIRWHDHLDTEAVRANLKDIRGNDTQNGILVVTEGLFSMDSDTPDLVALQKMCREYGATLLVDVAHDFGALGPGGTGHLGVQRLLGQVDLVMGAFSKTFASNGGFLATNSPAVKQFVKSFGGPHIFSNALSPVQTAVVSEALRIIRSEEGDRLRSRLLRAVCTLRDEFAAHEIGCLGAPSAIVPIPVGNEKVARLAYALVFERNVLANMVEFPVVAIGAARFRMQVMAAHTEEHARQAAKAVAESIHEARSLVASLTPPAGSSFVFSPGNKIQSIAQGALK